MTARQQRRGSPLANNGGGAMSRHDPITAGQAGKIAELLTAALRKSDLRSESVQLALENSGSQLADGLLAVVREHAEAHVDTVTRTVTVNRSLSPKQVLDVTGRRQYTTESVVAQMPKGEGDEVEVVFFKLGRWVSDDDLEKEYGKRGLIPADPYSLLAVNAADPAFADEHPNVTHWRDGDGRWCYTAFRRWLDERNVNVLRYDNYWRDSWWFAGLRK